MKEVETSDGESRSEDLDEIYGLFLRHIEIIRGFIRGLVRDQHLADDVLQETFLTVTRKAGSFQLGTSFPKWACAIARLKVLEVMRSQRGKLSFFDEETIEVLANRYEVDEVGDPRMPFLENCVSELPAGMKKMVTLRYEGGCKPTEIAERMGWTVEAVYVALSRARNLIRNCLNSKVPQAEMRS